MIAVVDHFDPRPGDETLMTTGYSRVRWGQLETAAPAFCWGFREERPQAYARVRYRLSSIYPADEPPCYEDAATPRLRIARPQGRPRTTLIRLGAREL